MVDLSPARTILVAEDDDDARAVVCKYLEGKGHLVRRVADGQAVLDVLAAFDDIDLVLLDVMMPRLSGFQVLEQLRGNGDMTPIIMATAAASPEDIVRALSLGADDYVTKPYSFPVLLARIELRLRQRADMLNTTIELQPSTLDAQALDPELLSRLRSLAEKWRRPTAHAARATEIGPGSVIADRYVIESEIGSGGFGAVWRARHVDLGQDVAIKVLAKDVAHATIDEFRREAQKACRVRHDNAVRVFDFGHLVTGSAFLVMELLEGPSLEQMIRIAAPLPVERSLSIMRPVLAALAAAHKQGIVHCDVKPANIMLHREDEREVPKLLDFGIAKDLEDVRDQGGILVGSPAYVAPERLRDMPYDGRSDVYACSIILFRMLTGTLPFDETLKDFEKVAMWHMSGAPPPPSSKNPKISPAVDDVVMQMMCKEPIGRPQARAACALIDAVLGEHGST